ncbi:hypothetical protein N0V90_001780 [Kalmusia sp. IMI 367209]|nr:hypothetical protein N0V90_001780 [Kalmusia sp. IMI 367209]
MDSQIDINIMPSSPSSPGWDVPRQSVTKNKHCGHVFGLVRTTPTTELGQTIKEAAIHFAELLRRKPSVEDVQAFLGNWTSASRGGKIQRMVAEWFELYRPVHIVVENDCMDLVEVLVDHGFKLGGASVALLVERMKQSSDVTMLEFMLTCGWNINRPISILGPILAHVISDDMLVSYALSLGASPNAASEEGYTPLHAAAAHASLSTLQLLLTAGGDISPSSPSAGVIAHAALSHSSSDNRIPIIKCLLDHGADINALYKADSENHKNFIVGRMTALHVAVRDGKRELVEWLLERGADAGRKTNGAATGFRWVSVGELAERRDHAELRELLERRVRVVEDSIQEEANL